MFKTAHKNILQPRLTIGQPNDRYEQEADQVADHVMSMSKTEIPGIQRKCANCEEEELQMKPLSATITPIIQKQEEEEEMLQMKVYGNEGNSISGLESSLQQSKGSGRNLDESTQSYMSKGIGADFSNVKIHTDSNAIQMNQQLNAKAFTNGSDVYFNQGQYNPQSAQGKHLLAHELTHVVQQNNSNISIQRAEIDDDPAHCDGLRDVSTMVNQYVNAAILRARGISNGRDRVQSVYNSIGRGSPFSAIEEWCERLPSAYQNRLPISHTRYQQNLLASRSGTGIFVNAWMKGERAIGTLLNIGGNCIGSDKLGHFFQQGRDYFQISVTMGRGDQYANWYGQWLEGILPNDPGFRAWLDRMDDADWPGFDSLMLGFDPWQGVYGLSTTGVYSRADLEANSDGMQFYKQINSNPSYVFDVQNVVDGNWNERTNPSCFSANIQRIITGNDPEVSRQYREAVERMIYPNGREHPPRMTSAYAGAHVLNSIVDSNLNRYERC